MISSEEPNENTELLEKLQVLTDRQEIGELIARLARGTDRVDVDLTKSCYAPDSCDDHGAFSGTGLEFASRPSRLSPKNLGSHHLLAPTSIDLRGDLAFCETYFLATYFIEEDGEAVKLQSVGRYLDRIVRHQGAWLIEYRRVVMDWRTEGPAGPPPPGLEAYARPQRWPDDAVFHPETLGPRGQS